MPDDRKARIRALLDELVDLLVPDAPADPVEDEAVVGGDSDEAAEAERGASEPGPADPPDATAPPDTDGPAPPDVEVQPIDEQDPDPVVLATVQKFGDRYQITMRPPLWDGGTRFEVEATDANGDVHQHTRWKQTWVVAPGQYGPEPVSMRVRNQSGIEATIVIGGPLYPDADPVESPTDPPPSTTPGEAEEDPEEAEPEEDDMVSISYGPPAPPAGALAITTTDFDDVAGGGTANQQIQVENGVGEVVMFPDPLDAADEHWPNSLFVTPDDQILLGTVEV